MVNTCRLEVPGVTGKGLLSAGLLRDVVLKRRQPFPELLVAKILHIVAHCITFREMLDEVVDEEQGIPGVP